MASSPRTSLEEGSQLSSSSSQLRHRSNNLSNSSQKKSETEAETDPNESQGVQRHKKQHNNHRWWWQQLMAPYFSRRAPIVSARSVSGGSASSGVSSVGVGGITNITGVVGQQQQQRATSYRNTFLTILVATALYTVFLYQRGQYYMQMTLRARTFIHKPSSRAGTGGPSSCSSTFDR